MKGILEIFVGIIQLFLKALKLIFIYLGLCALFLCFYVAPYYYLFFKVIRRIKIEPIRLALSIIMLILFVPGAMYIGRFLLGLMKKER